MRPLRLYQIVAGLCDSVTGLLLVVAPQQALRLMHVSVAPSPAVFTGYIGVFVLAVGLSYLWVLRQPLPASSAAWKTQWELTAIIRFAVACFVVQAVLRGQLDAAWLLVAATDAVFAVLQTIGLVGGWLERATHADTQQQ